VLHWIQSYLTGRSQFVRVGQEKSSAVACEYGVPQGSVLGPLLYTLYVAPIAGIIASFNINHLQYADDTQLYMALDGTNVSTNLDNCFKTVKEWFALNGLSLNPDKSEAIVIGTSARQRTAGPISTVAIDTDSIAVSESVRSLGVTIDNTLSFNTHINEIMCKSVRYHAHQGIASRQEMRIQC
jgi:Reverse transcriptase (RNA-dependent DNA polymerase)